jgi:polyphosphate kinase
MLEDVVAMLIDRFFPGEDVLECVPFRLTRNADMGLREDQAFDLLAQMEELLDARKESDCVRLEIADHASPELLGFLRDALSLGEGDVFAVPGPLDLSALRQLADLAGFDDLRYPPWPPQPSPGVDPTVPMFDVLAHRDLLLYHPYDSFEPVVRLIEEAARDPDVLAIKQILYRTSRDSPVVAALARAAEQGKYVTAVVELKARFDEARNIEWARSLEQAGVQVIYGIKGFKTHAKVCIIVRREPQGIQRYLHLGTGNYNEQTARLYSDVSFMTANEELAADATNFFNAISGYSQPQRFRKIEAAPIGLRERLVEMIESETHRKQQGQKAQIAAKLNSLVDPQIIDALYAASQAGVKVRLNVRGICCLRPGVPGLSENISVVSIVDRYLEHARILYFYHGGDERVFISSADWMPRNLDRRIELLVPVEDPASQKRLIAILETHLQDTVKARQLTADGVYEPVKPRGRRKPFRSQEELYRQACEAVKEEEQLKRTAFETHRKAASG